MRNSITDSASRTSQCAYRVRIVRERPRPPERLSDNQHGNLTPVMAFPRHWVEHSDDAKLCGADRPLTKKVCTAISWLPAPLPSGTVAVGESLLR